MDFGDIELWDQLKTWINNPIPFEQGPFEGRVILTRLEVEQDPLLGRKFGAADAKRGGPRDRRPLNPPPVVRLRLFEIFNYGTENPVQLEIPADGIDYGGFVVSATLFPVYPPVREEEAERFEVRPKYYPYYPIARSWDAKKHPNVEPAVFPLTAIPDSDPNTQLADAAHESQLHLRKILESSQSKGQGKQTRNTAHLPRETPRFWGDEIGQNFNLYGNSVANCAKISDKSSNQSALYFVFSDLSVRSEGYFALRYRVVNLLWQLPNTPPGLLPFTAECVSAPFAVYSTREFPGLAPPTPLTQHLYQSHIPVVMREITSKRPKIKDVDSDDDTNEPGLPRHPQASNKSIPEIRLNGAATSIVSPLLKPLPSDSGSSIPVEASASQSKELAKPNITTKAKSARGKDPRAEELMKLAKMIPVKQSKPRD